MSLYDDIIVGSNEKAESVAEPSEKAANSWSNTGFNLLKDHLLSKKNSSQFKKDHLSRRQNVTASGITMKIKTSGDEMPPPPVINALGKSTGSLLGGDWDVNQEYDPLWPNDYEKIMKERKEKKEKEASEVKAREMERKKRDSYGASQPVVSSLTARSLVDAYSDDEDDDKPLRNSSNTNARAGGAAFPPPPSLIEDTVVTDSENALKVATSMGVSSVAAKIMVKMGYKEGQGLGKEEQGISRALEVQKTSQRGGKIVGGDQDKDVFISPPPPPVMTPVSSQPATAVESITEIMKNPTKVVLLKNMVGRGEVDDDLIPEVKEECSKYGEIVNCLSYEMPASVNEDEAVRIFIEFKRVESAIKAVVDLNGRYFGGRIVKATFFDVDKFKNKELSD
ncbi:splicing factor 45-like protein [Dinothrombium tinctorium]|uniref:Splicing factor 45 n=1 Tax=Dinothrombium tinctorium TaxID=1965070 RepID=A0A3S3QB80_9ACAR|nr:splicing factor 45-like protein [Dinothrombium tinctorium]